MTSTMNSFKSVYMANGFRALARRPARTALAVGRKSRPLLNDKNDLRQDNYRGAFAVLLCGIAAELGSAPGLAENNRSAERLADIKRHGQNRKEQVNNLNQHHGAWIAARI